MNDAWRVFYIMFFVGLMAVSMAVRDRNEWRERAQSCEDKK